MNGRMRVVMIKDWRGPNFFFPKGTEGSLEYFSKFTGLKKKDFIEKFKEGKFEEWFESPNSQPDDYIMSIISEHQPEMVHNPQIGEPDIPHYDEGQVIEMIKKARKL